MEFTTIVIIILTYFIASFFGSMIGGGSLLAIPVLIFAGLPPHIAIGTNKIGSMGISYGASVGYKKEQKLELRSVFFLMLFGSIGAIIGSLIILSIPENLVKKIISFIIIAITAFLLVDKDGKAKISKKINQSLLSVYVFLSGIYSGFYTAGVGIINRFVFSKFFSLPILSGSALSTMLGVASNSISFLVFAYFGYIKYSLFVPILLTSVLGAYLGAKYSVRLGNEKIKYVLAAASLIMAIKLLFF